MRKFENGTEQPIDAIADASIRYGEDGTATVSWFNLDDEADREMSGIILEDITPSSKLVYLSDGSGKILLGSVSSIHVGNFGLTNHMVATVCDAAIAGMQEAHVRVNATGTEMEVDIRPAK